MATRQRPRHRFTAGWWLLITAAAVLSALLFLWNLGGRGLVDETPPLFAAAARGMVETGDWLTPRVNGHPRFDKPVLIYWLMGLGYGLLPPSLDPLGSLAARLPSALSATAVAMALADLLWCWPQEVEYSRHPMPPWVTPLSASFAFGLCPLVLVWSRTAVSDLLLTALLSLSLMGFWRHQAAGRNTLPTTSWILLGLAVLSKGPVALVLAALTVALYGIRQGQLGRLWHCLSPLRGGLVVALVALPWYVAELAVEGRAFWDSFFVHHNFERLTRVVNSHDGPLWFYIPVLLVGAAPQLPLALYSTWRGLADPLPRGQPAPAASLRCFAASWFLTVVLLFTLAATKLPSYVLPAMPAVGLLVGLAGADLQGGRISRSLRLSVCTSLGLMVCAGIGFLLAPFWLAWIREPEMPTLAMDLEAAGIVPRVGVICLVAAALGIGAWRQRRVGSLLPWQCVLALWVPFGLLPIGDLGDRLRQQPVRAMAAAIKSHAAADEPIAMAGINKPSLHFYSGRVVRYEGGSQQGLANILHCSEWGAGARTLLVVLDNRTAAQPHWLILKGDVLARSGLYQLRRLHRKHLEDMVEDMVNEGLVQHHCLGPGRHGDDATQPEVHQAIGGGLSDWRWQKAQRPQRRNSPDGAGAAQMPQGSIPC